MANFDIKLIDHIIVSGKYYRPIFEGEKAEHRLAAPINFSYGEAVSSNGIRVCNIATTAEEISE